MRRTRAGVLVVVAGTLLLLTGCRGGAASADPAPAGSPAPASSTAASSTAGSTVVSSDPGPQLDDIESTLTRIERELDTDAGR